MDTLTQLSLFSGYGGTELGLKLWGELAGVEVRTVAYCEIDKYCQRILQARIADGCLDDAPIFDDVRLIHTKAYLDTAVKTWYNPKNGTDYSLEEEVMAGKLKKLTVAQAEECVTMYESGMSLAPIAGYFAVSRQAMWELLRRRTTMRPQKRTGTDNHFSRGGKTADDHAQNMAEYAVRKGIIERRTVCDICSDAGTFKDGRTKIQVHHDDYNKPLSVRWLCQNCHHQWHKHHKAKRKEAHEELPDVKIDMISGGFP